MTIIEKAAELGAMIADTEEKKRLDKATAAYEADEDMKAMIEKYNEHSKSIADRQSAGDISSVSRVFNPVSILSNPYKNCKYRFYPVCR